MKVQATNGTRGHRTFTVTVEEGELRDLSWILQEEIGRSQMQDWEDDCDELKDAVEEIQKALEAA